MPSELAFLFVRRTRLLSRRDTAIIMLLLDAGARRNEFSVVCLSRCCAISSRLVPPRLAGSRLIV
jgi:hypothetical protein